VVRTRFAPSPTGHMHIGNLRTALYAYLIARHHGGRFVLRIEDTDRKRYVPGAMQVIYDSLELARLEYDEGPNKDGGFGPYIQSQRQDIYEHHIEYLLGQGSAYRCFCTSGRAEQRRKGQKAYGKGPDPCRFLSGADVDARIAAGESYVVRQRIPGSGTTTVVDHVFGKITVSHDTLDDQVLLKSDGLPTYNFANVVDDHLMEISHVVRGIEYLSSAPKYNLLYLSFGWDIPEYVHLPHITKESGKKLSKRAGDASFQDLLARGYLPEALVNFVALLGWNPGDERELFVLEDLVAAFGIDRINKSSAAFSYEKLDWLNGEHIRHLSLERFHKAAMNHYPREIVDTLDTRKISRIIQPRVVRLTDIPQMVSFFAGLPSYSLDLYDHDKSQSSAGTSHWVLENVYPVLSRVQEWTNEVLYQEIAGFAQDANMKIRTVMWPLRVALSGSMVTAGGATEIAEVLGKEETLRRLSDASKRLSTCGSATGAPK
jgi:glutamyl-tRNA synthetase